MAKGRIVPFERQNQQEIYRLAAEFMICSPQPTGHVEHDCLQSENNRDPLVVADLGLQNVHSSLSLCSFPHFSSIATRFGDIFFEGDEEGVLDEAVVFGILLPAASEFGRHPALDWRPNIPKGSFFYVLQKVFFGFL